MRVAISGGANGIGAAAAKKLKSQGAWVACFDRQEPSGDCDQWIDVDLSDPEAIAGAAGRVEDGLDAVINSAGLPPRAGLQETVLAVNYFGLVALTRALEPKLSNQAAIVNMASRAGARWRDNLSQVKALMRLANAGELPSFVAAHRIDPVRAYDLSKEAVIVWTMAQAERLLGQGVRANTVSPAAVSTGILDDFIAAFGDRARTAIARTGRPGTADEIAEVICFLAGPQSAWIKGADIAVDGGVGALANSDLHKLGAATD